MTPDPTRSFSHPPGTDPVPMAAPADGSTGTLPEAVPARHHPLAAPGAARYAVTHLHACGGIGQVWAATDAVVGREVALKDLRPERAGNPGLWPRFLHEAKVTGQLQHPGIVPVYEIGTKPGTGEPYYTMRLVHGETLEEAVQNYHRRRRSGTAGRLDLRDLLAAFVGVCHAVAYAHSRGVLHRDLKPRNVVLGNFGEVIVLDWGLARVLPREAGADSTADPEPPLGFDPGTPDATLQGQVLGTPAYMAPEQARGEIDSLGPRTDVYGLGAVLYEILTGQPPFTGTTTAEVLDQVRHTPPEPPRSVVRSVPRELQAVCLKAMAKRPGERYASAGALADDVRHFLADEPLSAYRAPLHSRLARWARRNRSAVAALVAGILVLTAGGIALGVRQVREQERVRADAAVRAEAERAEVERLIAEADRRHAIGLTAARAGDVDRAVAALSEAVGFCEQSATLAGRRQEIARHLADIERYRTFDTKTRAALNAAVDPTPLGERPVRERENPAGRACEDALAVYGVLSRADWAKALDTPALAPAQADAVRSDAHELLVTFAMSVGGNDPRRGLELLDRADRIQEPRGVGVWLLRVQWYRQLGAVADAGRASAMGAKAAREDPGTARDLVIGGNVLLGLGQPEKAAEVFELAARHDPAYFPAHFGRFRCAVERNDARGRLTPLTACLALRPGDPNLYYFRGMARFELGEYEDAFLDFDTAVKRDPNYPLGYFYRGRMRVIERKWTEAEKDFTRAVELDPELTQARSWRAIARAKSGRPAEAAADAERCVAEEPTEPLTAFYAARALAQCAGAARTAGDGAAAARYAGRSVELLRTAFKLGFRDSERLLPGGDFDPVRAHPDFGELLKKFPPPKKEPK